MENRGNKKYCSKCKRKIDRLEDYYRLKYVRALSNGENIIRLFCLKCGEKIQ